MAGAGNNIYNQVTTGLQGAQTGINNAMAYQPTQFSNEAIQPFMNPFTQNVLDRVSVEMTSVLSQDEDVDLSTAIVNLTQEQDVFQAALASGNTVIPQSLMDFI